MHHNPRRILAFGLLVGWTAAFATAATATAADKLRLLIIDGQNNHDWKAMTPPMKADLEASGRFVVDVATTPSPKTPKSDWSTFHPDFSKYDVILSNYNGEPWPGDVQKALESFVEQGGGLVVVHAANNAFTDWSAWNAMIGLGWRGANFGDRITIDNAGKVVRTPRGEGPGAGHGRRHEYKVVVRNSGHPVTQGMPSVWMHAQDELYHGQRGPARNMEILAYAYSDPSTGGTGANEPLIWTIPFGKGRVFTTLLGHAWEGDVTAIQCIGFKTVLLRGAEWAATGNTTIPIPKDFPTPAAVRIARPK